METFLDGGLFELLAALAALSLWKFIKASKWVRVIFTIITLASMICVFIIDDYYLPAIVLVINSIILLSLLWETQIKSLKKKKNGN